MISADVLLWVLAAILVIVGLAGLFLPVLPGGRAAVCRTRGSNMSPINAGPTQKERRRLRYKNRSA